MAPSSAGGCLTVSGSPTAPRLTPHPLPTSDIPLNLLLFGLFSLSTHLFWVTSRVGFSIIYLLMAPKSTPLGQSTIKTHIQIFNFLQKSPAYLLNLSDSKCPKLKSLPSVICS